MAEGKKGRQSATHTRLRQAGRIEEANAIAPPSERRLTESDMCGAKLKSKDGNCRKRKGDRTDHLGYGNCAQHGGNTEAGVKSAMREMGRDLAQKYKASRRFGGDRTDPSLANLTPEQALLEEVRRTAAFVRFLEERIGSWNLTPPSQEVVEAFAASTHPIGHKAMRESGLSGQIEKVLEELDHQDPDSPNYLPALTAVHPRTGLTSFTDAREWLYLYREERGHLARVSKMCIDAGVAQRLVSIAEDQGRILAAAIRAVLQALNLTPEQAALVPRVVPPVLRAVATDSPIPLALTSSLGSPDEKVATA